MSDNLEVESRVDGDLAVVTTDGYINNTAAESIAKVCGDHLDAGARKFVLNLAKSRIINSIGISILIEVIEKVRGEEGSVAFCQVTPTIEKTFRIMGLMNTSTVHGTEEEAVAHLTS